MSKIRILPEHLANQIAAGEVIERPASVVKELLENSLDAGADRIEIEIEGGGTRLIRVIDNGEGMDEDDILLSLERHGTSKIREDRDLAAIATLGFRGEAIPSIGSVSQMTITSRTTGAELGNRAVVSYGKLIKIHQIGAAVGTQFEVGQLFGNTPARRKFLRTARTELAHIDEVVKNYALGSPDITFILRVDGKEVLHFARTLSLEQRLTRIIAGSEPFLQVGNPAATAPAHRVYGFLAPPEASLAAAARLRLFVNGRAVRDRLMAHAVVEGLRSFLMKGKNPAGLIHLVIPAQDVDVNVHPAKHEVRFRNSRDIHLLISQAVSQAMHARQKNLQSRLFGRERMHDSTPIPLNPLDSVGPSDLPPVPSFTATEEIAPFLPDTTFSGASSIPAEAIGGGRPALPPQPQTPQYQKITLSERPLRVAETDQIPRYTAPPPAEPREKPAPRQVTLTDTGDRRQDLQIIGQLDDLYILCQNSEGLVIIDQHAAHERLLFEDLRSQYLSERIASQNLLFPETVEFSLFQARLVEKHMEELSRMGFSLRHFGGNSYVISGIPALAGQCAPQGLLLDMLEQFGSENGQADRENRFDRILATMACRAAVKAGARLTTKEIEALLDRMVKADLFSHCPHGRPVWKNISRLEIKKWFHRT
jgi:DNA mismatch repair protein MutL